MKKSIAIFSLILAVAILSAQCKSSSKCTYKPRQAKQSTIWQQKG